MSLVVVYSRTLTTLSLPVCLIVLCIYATSTECHSLTMSKHVSQPLIYGPGASSPELDSLKNRRRSYAFVPMRGKKAIIEYDESDNGIPPRELDQSDVSLNQIQARLRNGDNSLIAIPRRFVYQFDAQNQINSMASMQNNAIGSGVEYPHQSQAPTLMMEAKLRRAFHPMRGKRVELIEPSLDNDSMYSIEDNIPTLEVAGY